ncbi:UV-stimulated scaffold protein A [Tamandua tetradactyla]|uniref:UV-stimulated scaffold protein A n=1 Tax=Tamandua tetradactyla TaxID=48850 RepID=UPI004053E063
MDQKLPRLIEELTTSGEPKLNPEKMKELKKICKVSEEQLGHAYRLLMTQLSQEHSEVRLSAFHVVDELFARSHQFRTLVVSNFQEFLELTLETNHERLLPPPREAAQRLKQAAVRSVREWGEKYGEAYKKLALGVHFLRHNKKVDFQDVNVRTVAERERDERKQKHLDAIYRERAKHAEREMEEMSGEIGSCLTEVDSCFRLLVPCDWTAVPGLPAPGTPCAEGPPDDEQPCCSTQLSVAPHCWGAGEGLSEDEGQDEDEDEDEDPGEEAFVRNHGLGSHKYALDLELSSDDLKVQESEDNSAVIHAARDALRLIHNKFLPAASSWVQLFTRAGVHDARLKRAIDLKAGLDVAVRKSKYLHIEPAGGWRMMGTPVGDQDSEDDEEFVEVPEKEGFEADVPKHLWPTCRLEPATPIQALQKDLVRRSGAKGLPLKPSRTWDKAALDPTSAAAQPQLLQDRLPAPPPASPSTALLGADETQRLAAERARAPVVPFGVDLCYWGQDPPTAGKILRPDSQHRFWKPCEVEAEADSADLAAALRTRHIAFPGTFVPVQHRCRAPRPDGRLCERQDLLKCPFHGKIVPRDDRGQPLNPEDRAREQRQQLQRQALCPEWRDPEFMRDIEAATGLDLGSSQVSRKGSGQSKKKKFPKLTDLKQQVNTSRARLGRKVFAKAAVQRVASAMSLMDRKKHDKFANQFNYALS